MNQQAVQNAFPDLREEFLAEYSAEENIRRYIKKTAGHGISYLLDHDYGNIYLEVLDKYISKPKTDKGLRLLEFGCGAGMNLLHLVSVLEQRGNVVDSAFGTDFSGAIIESAKVEAQQALKAAIIKKVHFCVANSETLIGDMTKELRVSRESLAGSFDLVFGVNTIRYSHRLKNEVECAAGIFELLSYGGVCVVIDMNDRFPAFRSRFRDRSTKKEDSDYLPTLDEYARPFSSAGFELLRKENFCWVPHSAGRSLTAVMRLLTPVLNRLVRGHAMRSLVIARKTLHR